MSFLSSPWAPSSRSLPHHHAHELGDEEALCIVQYVKQAYGLLADFHQVVYGPILDEPTVVAIEKRRSVAYSELLSAYPLLKRLDRQVARRWNKDVVALHRRGTRETAFRRS